MKLCVLTYDTPHLKTAQVLAGLVKNGFSGIDLMLMPFVQRQERKVLFKHRPDQFVGAHVRELAAKHDCQVLKYDAWKDHLHRYDAFLVCGSNLVEPEFARTGKILNVHAGLIPMVRGLDSFKWAILKGYPLGNTLHRIDERADAGEVIAQLRTEVFADDTLQSLAARHYAQEIWMLSSFFCLSGLGQMWGLVEQPATMRMPIEVEARLLKTFDRYKHHFALSRPVPCDMNDNDGVEASGENARR